MRNDRNQLSNSSNAAGGTSAANQNSSSNLSGTANESGAGSSRTGSANLSTNNASNNSGSVANANADRDSFSRWRDRQYYGPRRWFQSARDESQWEKDNGNNEFYSIHFQVLSKFEKKLIFFYFVVVADTKKKDSSSGLPLWISDDLEIWPEKDTPIRFTQIAALHSELIAVSTKGELHQWRWSDTEPYKNYENPSIFHPKTQSLNLIYEKVCQISASSIRCTIATESNRVATWMDEQLGHTGSKLEHAATNFSELGTEKIQSLHTCTLYTVVRTENSNLFWWGVLPFGQRKRLWDKHKAKSKKPVRSSVSSAELTVGAQVCMKNSPMYQPGAIGFTISNGVPKVGQLLNSAWDLTDICRFKIITMPPPTNNNGSSSSNLASASGESNVFSSAAESFSDAATDNALLRHVRSDLKDLVKTSTSSGNNLSTSSTSKSSTSGSNKETNDRLDMPPPPSPASSTCSDTGSVSSHKRPKRAAPKEDTDPKKDEEQWMLK